jgi:hypothetical protein
VVNLNYPPASLPTMSGSFAPGKQGKEVDKLTREGRRSFDSNDAGQKAKKALKKDPGLQAELHGEQTAVSTSTRKPKRKKSRVSYTRFSRISSS